MDIFKLLSRSTKLPRHPPSKLASNGAVGRTSTIPSDGPSSTPQLFGTNPAEDNEMLREIEPVLGKRKRGHMMVDEAIPAELDFFGERKPQVVDKEKTVSKQSGVGKLGRDNTVANNDLEDEKEDFDVDAFKRVLRAHKIKITALSYMPATLEPDADLKQKKKSKKRKKQEEELKKAKAKSSQTYVRPLSSFVQLQRRYGLKNIILENILAQGYSVPTEVQLAGLPLLMGEPLKSVDADGSETVSKGNPIDLLTVAPTGSGKTLAFLIPILNALLLNRKKSAPSERPASRAVIIAPTRELASQIVNEGRKLGIKTGLKISLLKKGMKIGTDEDHVIDVSEVDNDGVEGSETSDEDQTSSLSRTIVKSDVVVSTPMALVHALERKDASVARLPSVQYLVLDEADVLLDPLFREQTLSIWHACTNPELRTTLWSATMGASIESLALSTMSNRKEAQPAPIIRLVIGLKDMALPTLTHTLTYAATEAGKLLALRQLLHPIASTSSDLDSGKELRPPFLVFAQTIARAIALQSELRYDIPPEAGGSSRMAVLHAGLSESARSRVMAGFRRGEIWVIITTDLLARGVDFRGLNGVVNYDVPTSAAAYVHRAGRTGRAGRKGGVVITLYTKEDVPFIKPVANVIAASEKARGDGGIESSSVQQWLLDALPTPSKRDKKNLKQRGLEIRRPGVKGATISTKAPKNHAKGAWNRSKRAQPAAKATAVEDTEFQGFTD
jgi:ATP-dependent RNA helicase DDX52/ROK1